MSYASNARAEMARELCAERCCSRAELAAALLCSGGISYRFGSAPRYALSITATEAAAVRHYFQLLKRHFGVASQIRTLRGNSLRGATRYQLVIPDEASAMLLEETGLLDPEGLFGLRQTPPEALVDYACCKKSFLKSAFMVSGAMANPELEYHIEIAAPSEEFADYVLRALEYFEIRAKKTCRKSKHAVYLKKSDDISDMLALMGAPHATLELQSVRVKKEMGNRVNRQNNCDHSNIRRVVDTAVRQVEDIRYIERELGLDKLPEPLRAVAELRLENQSLSLANLGELLEPPLGKSGVNVRLRRLGEIAEKLRRGEEVKL